MLTLSTSTVRRVLLVLFVGLVLLIFVLLGGREARRAATATECQSQIYNLGAALIGYQKALGCLPPPFITGPDGTPLYSWRVLIQCQYEKPEINDEFDFTRAWNDPSNMRLDHGIGAHGLKHLFSCPAIADEGMTRTDFFYAMTEQDRWPADFFLDDLMPVKVLLVENPGRHVYWSAPGDFVYAMGVEGFLKKLREIESPHRSGYSCFASDGGKPWSMPANAHASDFAHLFRTPDQMSKGQEQKRRERIDLLVAKLIRTANASTKQLRIQALLLLGELGPDARSAISVVRQAIADSDPRLSRVAVMALARIEK